MPKRIAHIALLVDDYDAAINFYTNKLDFRVVEDTALSDDKRWVVVAPGSANECSLLLAKAANEDQAGSVGNQSGGRVFLFLLQIHLRQTIRSIAIAALSLCGLRKPLIMEQWRYSKICMGIYGIW